MNQSNDEIIYAGAKIIIDDTGFEGKQLPNNVHKDYGESLKIVYNFENLNHMKEAFAKKLDNITVDLMELYLLKEGGEQVKVNDLTEIDDLAEDEEEIKLRLEFADCVRISLFLKDVFWFPITFTLTVEEIKQLAFNNSEFTNQQISIYWVLYKNQLLTNQQIVKHLGDF